MEKKYNEGAACLIVDEQEYEQSLGETYTSETVEKCYKFSEKFKSAKEVVNAFTALLDELEKKKESSGKGFSANDLFSAFESRHGNDVKEARDIDIAHYEVGDNVDDFE